MDAVRTCVGCRQRSSQSEMFRIVNQSGTLQMDSRRGLSGRGAWLHANPQCLELAITRRAFARAFRSSSPLNTRLLEEQAEKMLAK